MATYSLAARIAMLGALGKSRFAPGTVGTIVAGAPAAWILSLLPLWVAVLLVLLLFVVGCHVSEKAERELECHDPRSVVIDELVGFLVTMIGVPFTAKSLVLGIAAFRLFDIWKPWPVSVFDQKIKGGVGIVLDDVCAGILAQCLARIILAFLH